MTVQTSESEDHDEGDEETMDGNIDGVVDRPRQGGVKMRNHWVVATLAVVIWLVITIMNVANLVLLGKGEGA
jgi:metal iron transporter